MTMIRTDLQDRIHKARNAAARIVGLDATVYRPSGYTQPLAPVNLFLHLSAAFTTPDGKFARPNGYGDALWYGLFDATQTRPGDYLVQQDAIWFIAAQQRLLPVLCVQTNRIVSFWRPAAPANTGVNTYGGVTPTTNALLLADWPANVAGASGRGHQDSGLPSDSSAPYWTVLLPAIAGVILRPSDLMSDDLGRNAVVAAAELSQYGWRITVRQATT